VAAVARAAVEVVIGIANMPCNVLRGHWLSECSSSEGLRGSMSQPVRRRFFGE
jgi:hypothetical protein